MKRDAELEFSVAQALTATAVSTNVVDIGAPGDASADRPLYLCIRFVAAAVSAGASTLTVDLQTDSDSAFGTAVTLISTGALAKTALTANTWIARIALPQGLKRYNRLNYTVATADLSAGTVDAFITDIIDVRR